MSSSQSSKLRHHIFSINKIIEEHIEKLNLISNSLPDCVLQDHGELFERTKDLVQHTTKKLIERIENQGGTEWNKDYQNKRLN